MTRTLTGVSAHLCASHRDPLTGALHGHTWLITVKLVAEPTLDARALKAQLEREIAKFDHTELPSDLSSGEQLAEHFGIYLDAVEVEVSRSLEGIYAWWFK